MLTKKILSIGFLLLACSINFYSQTYISGQVVDVVDGRTLLVETAQNARVIFRLQHIEVPEAEQPLAEIVKNHLRELAFGKTVNIRSNSLSSSIVVGQVVLKGGIDLSQQMLRDGAAWFFNEGTESLDGYKMMEAAAKAEKRGIWGVEGLKPAWEFRQDKKIDEQKKLETEQKKLEEEKLANAQKFEQTQDKQNQNTAQPLRNNTQPIIKFTSSEPNFVLEYDKTTNESYVSSPMQTFVVSDGENSLEILLGFGYEFVGNTMPKEIDDFGIAVGSMFVAADFLRESEVTMFTDDGKKLKLGKPKTKFSVQKGKIVEVLFYKIEREELVKLAANAKPVIKIGKHQRILDKSSLNVISILLRPTA